MSIHSINTTSAKKTNALHYQCCGKSNVIEMSSNLHRLRSSDRLIQHWIEIEKIDDPEHRVVAIFKWKQKLSQHQKDFD